MIFHQDTVLVGQSPFSESILSNSELKRGVGVKAAYSSNVHIGDARYAGNIEDLLKDLEDLQVNRLIFCDDIIAERDYKKILDIAELKMIRMYFLPGFKWATQRTPNYKIIANFPFVSLMKEPLTNSSKRLLKRSFDFVFSFLVIVFVLSWLVPIVALIIKLESKGPVFFLQKRSGIKNEPFNCIKFRSMTVNAVADSKMAQKGDTRITKFGEIMRKTSIDELPQFFNVFIGNMSVVGPRPHMLSQTRQYSKITKKYMLRHMIKPGITGWAQVMGSRGEIFSDKDMELRVEKDIWYIQNWSFFLDLKIIFLTFYNVVKGDEQAY